MYAYITSHAYNVVCVLCVGLKRVRFRRYDAVICVCVHWVRVSIDVVLCIWVRVSEI